MNAVTVVVPTVNEAGAIRYVLRSLLQQLDALGGTAARIVVVDDDSTDGTAQVVESIAAGDDRVLLVRRPRRDGIASAFIDGARVTTTPLVALMDGDCQHDSALIPLMREHMGPGIVLVSGNRFMVPREPGGQPRMRRALSWLGSVVTRRMLDCTASDPLAGVFLVRREVLDATALRIRMAGWKPLLVLLADVTDERRVEVPYRLRPRCGGSSKLTCKVLWDFGWALLSRLCQVKRVG